MVDVLHSRVVGPLESYAQGFAAELARQGYTVGSATGQLGLVAHLSRWLAGRRLGVTDLTPVVVGRYVKARRGAGYHNLRSGKALAPLLGYLAQIGVAADPVPALAQAPGEVLLGRYRDYLISERGLGVRTVRGYLDLVGPFVGRCLRDGGSGLGELSAGDVSSFLVAESRRLSPKTVQRLASALRSLLGYWHLCGVVSKPLAGAVPKVAYRNPDLPRGLPPGPGGSHDVLV